MGKAFSLEENVFVAPKEGIYEFAFNGHKTGKQESLNVSLRINGKEAFNAWSHYMMGIHNWSLNYMVHPFHRFRNLISLHSLVKLNKGDRIDLFAKQGSFYDSNTHHNHFTGKLLWEDTTNKINTLVSTNTTKELEETMSPLTVYFVAQKNTPFGVQSATIPFDIVNFNIGESFNSEKNVFTAPTTGIYEFTFKGFKRGGNYEMVGSLRLNGKLVANAFSGWATNHNIHNPFSIYSLLKVQKGDVIDLYLDKGKLFDDNNQYTTFTGKLLMEINKKSQKSSTAACTSMFRKILPSLKLVPLYHLKTKFLILGVRSV